MIKQIEIINGTANEILLDFSKKVSNLTSNSIILFSNHFLDHIFTVAHYDSNIDRSSTYIGIQDNLEGHIEARIKFKNGLELKFTRKEVCRYVYMITYLEFTSKELEESYTYYLPETIDGIWHVYKIAD